MQGWEVKLLSRTLSRCCAFPLTGTPIPELVGEDTGVSEGIWDCRSIVVDVEGSALRKPVKDAVEGLGVDGMVAAELVAECISKGGGSGVELRLFHRSGLSRHGQ